MIQRAYTYYYTGLSACGIGKSLKKIEPLPGIV